MARESLADLITKLRRLIGDTAGASQVWSDDELQAFLDEQRQDYQDWALVRVPRLVSGVYVYKDFWAQNRLGDWESDVVIADLDGNAVTPDADTSEPLLGHWRFATSQTTTLYLTGKTYDVHGAAAEVLKAWAAKEKLSFDFSTDNQSFKESQKAQMLLDLAKQFDGKRRVGSGALLNSEFNAYSC